MIEDVVFISARRGYITNGLVASGYRVVCPYKDKTLIGRFFREVWFKLRLPEQVWYEKVNTTAENIIVHDPLITRRYLLWLQKKHSYAFINYMYANMVGRAKHLLPESLPDGIIPWTYDPSDAEKYNLKVYHGGGYFTLYIGKKQEPEYDVFFVGLDKGRAEYLLDLEKQMNELGLITKFIIAADGHLAKKKSFYSKPISYKEVVEYDNKSRAILNITMPNQKGASLRDFESIFNCVKLITTNSNIKNYDFYIEDNVFILGERELTELPEFLDRPFIPVDEEILKRNTIDSQVEEIIKKKQHGEWLTL